MFDILGAYFHTETYKGVIVFMEGALSEIVVKVASKIYWKYDIMSIKGKTLLYVQIQKTLYGQLCINLLFYMNLVNYLKAHLFQINPYGPYVTNNIINNNQMTVVWHVDFLKVSHVDIFEITKFAT